MARKTTPQKYLELVRQARIFSPDIAITTDLIVGFPGEGEEEFRESAEFVRTVKFAAGHVFHFSDRPGTAAAGMTDKVAAGIRKERSRIMRHLFNESTALYLDRFIGRALPVLWEHSRGFEKAGGWVEGLSDNYIRVRAEGDGSRWNTIDMVQVSGAEGQYLTGTIVG
jgi:threonylcarbamoyladenosine tRNA methylthiotransferase MtaB